MKKSILLIMCACGPIEPVETLTGKSEDPSETTSCNPTAKEFEKCSEDCECESEFCKLFENGTGFCSRSCPPFGSECSKSQICVNDGEFCAIDCKANQTACEIISGLECVEIFNGSVCLPVD